MNMRKHLREQSGRSVYGNADSPGQLFSGLWQCRQHRNAGGRREQGTIWMISKEKIRLMTDLAIEYMSMVGSVLIFCVGVNLVWGKKVSVANMLPSLLLAVAAAYLPWTF